MKKCAFKLERIKICKRTSYNVRVYTVIVSPTHPVRLYSTSTAAAESAGRGACACAWPGGGSAYGLGSGSAPSLAPADWQRALTSQQRTRAHTTCVRTKCFY